MPGNFLPALFLPLLSLSPLAPLSVPAPRVSGVHGLNFLIPPAPHPGSLSSMYRPLAAPTSTPSRSLSSNLLPFVFLEVPFYLGFSISPSLFHYFTLSFSLFHPLFFTITFSLSLSHSLSRTLLHPLPCTFTGMEERERCPLPTKCIFQWGFGNVNTPQAQTVGCVLSRTNTKSVTERVHVTCSSAWGRDLQGGECKVDD